MAEWDKELHGKEMARRFDLIWRKAGQLAGARLQTHPNDVEAMRLIRLCQPSVTAEEAVAQAEAVRRTTRGN